MNTWIESGNILFQSYKFYTYYLKLISFPHWE